MAQEMNELTMEEAIKPYRTLLKECLEILAMYPFKSQEADFAATKIKESMSFIREKIFEHKYYELRKEFKELEVPVLSVEEIHKIMWEEKKVDFFPPSRTGTYEIAEAIHKAMVEKRGKKTWKSSQ